MSRLQGLIPPGWIGGFAQTDPRYLYPDPDLSSLPMLHKMANIGKRDRQQAVLWPEFSWESDDADHGSPDGPGTSARYKTGALFEPLEGAVEREIDAILKFIQSHL